MSSVCTIHKATAYANPGDSAIVRLALEVSDLSETEEGGATLLVRQSKTGRTGSGAVLFLTATTLQLLREWFEWARIQKGRLFRSVSSEGVPGESLDGSQVPRIFKGMARKAGFEERNIERISSHSPRVGATQDMIASHQGLAAVMYAGRWKTAAMAMRYGESLLAQRGGEARFAQLNCKNRTSG